MEKALEILNHIYVGNSYTLCIPSKFSTLDVFNAIQELEEARHIRREWHQKGYNEAMKPKPKQTVVIEKWLCKSAWENYFIIEGEVEFFKTGGYDKQQVKLLDTYEVEL